MQTLREEHMDATHRVLRYLKATPGHRILLRSDSTLQVHSYCVANWGACPLTRCSLTSYLGTLGGSLMAWRTKK